MTRTPDTQFTYAGSTVTAWRETSPMNNLKPRAAKPRAFIHIEGENMLENLMNRRDRPQKLYRAYVLAAIRSLMADQPNFNPDQVTLRWSQKAGCSCPCSPGFIVDGAGLTDIHITIYDPNPDDLKIDWTAGPDATGESFPNTDEPVAVNETLHQSSSSERVYTTTEWNDGTVTCNCPGWTFKKPNKERSCKHTDAHQMSLI